MKQTLLFILMAILMVALGCQPTPEKDVVAPKDIERIIIQVQDDAGSDTDSGDAKRLSDEIIGDSDVYSDSFTSSKGKVAYRISATLEVPNVDDITIQRVKKHLFSQTEATIMLSTFLGEAKLYQLPNMLSREQMEELLIHYYGMRDGSIPMQVDGEDGQSAEKLEEIIAYYEEALRAAEDSYYRSEASTEFSKPIYAADANSQVIEGVSVNSNGDVYFCVKNCYPGPNDVSVLFVNTAIRDGALYNSRMPYHNISDSENLKIPATLVLSQDDAVQRANNLLHALGIEEMDCVQMGYAVIPNDGSNITPYVVYQSEHAQGFQWAHKLQFTRLVNGVPITMTRARGTGVKDEDHYAEPWEYEKLEVYVDDAGIVGFEYISPYEIAETITKDAKLLPFADIASVARTMLPAAFSWLDESPETKSAAIDITKIGLGMMRITEPNQRDSGLLVPVWDFWGVIKRIDANGNESVFQHFDSLLTINAIDGSVINRNLGY